MGFSMNLLESIRPALLKEMPTQSRDIQAQAELQALEIGKLVNVFINWRDRQIYQRPRKVLKSVDLLVSASYSVDELRCRRLFAKIASGQELTSHLSRDNRVSYLSQARRKRRRHRPDLDLMLNEWGIHHLHLSEADPADGHSKTDSVLLFVMFKSNTAYALALMPHGEWINEDLVGIAVRNWPESGLFHKLSGAHSERRLSPEERGTLRRNYVGYLNNVDGQLYMPDSGGLSSNGTSTKAVMQLIALQRCCSLYDEQPELLSAQLKEEAHKIGAIWPSRPSFRCILIPGVEHLGFGILEEKSGVAIGISGL